MCASGKGCFVCVHREESERDTNERMLSLKDIHVNGISSKQISFNHFTITRYFHARDMCIQKICMHNHFTLINTGVCLIQIQNLGI